MTFTPDRLSARWRGLALALALGLFAPAGASAGLADNLMRDAHAALARGDGVAAEIALRKAMSAGFTREAVAAGMGEAYLDQGDLHKAREWLGPARFAPAEAGYGFRMLGRLEMADRNLPAAGHAFDRALALTPSDSALWVDIARLRYAGGEQIEAAQAAEQAARFDPSNVRALEFRGLLVRDQYGLAAALPWFEAGLKLQPDDIGLLGQYAATLGELGRVREMLTVTRRMIELEPRNPQAFFLQAVLAARAGNTELARGLMARSGGALAGKPAATLLESALALDEGNANQALGLLEGLVANQPRNQTARLLLARALYAAGEREQLITRFSADAGRADAAPYLLTLLGRAQEDLGRRDLAAALLDRAARAGAPGYAIISDEQGSPAAPDLSYDSQLHAGDLRLVAGDLAGAVGRYRGAALVRLSDDVLERLIRVYVAGGNRAAALQLVNTVLANAPRHRLALRLAARFAAEAGDWKQAAATLDWLARTGDARDARLQADLALARLRSGEGDAEAAARQAWDLQRASPLSAQSLGMALAASGHEAQFARGLLDQAKAIGGSNPLLVESEAKLALLR